MAFRWVKFFFSKKLKIKFRLSFHPNPLLSLLGTAAFYVSVMTLSAWFWAAISRADSTNLNSSSRHLLLINDGGGLVTNFTDFVENLRLARQYLGGQSEEILNGGGLAAGAFDYRSGKIAASVVTSRDQAATKAQIINSLNKLAKQGGRALVFVTGHGQAEGLVTWDGQLITRKEFSDGLQKSGIPQTKMIFLQCYGAGMLGPKTDEFAKLDIYATQKKLLDEYPSGHCGLSAAADDEYAYSLSNTASSSATSLSVVESAKKTICQATTQKELQESNRRIAELSRAYEQFQSVNDTCKNKFLKKNLPEKSREYELAKSGLGQLANLENQAYNKPMMLSNSNRQKRESMELKRDAFDGVKATLDSMPSYQDFLGVCLSRMKDFADPAFVDFRNYLLKNHRQGQDIEQELLLDLQKSQGARKKKRLALMTTRQNVLEEYLKGDLAMRPLFKRYLELRRCEQETIR